MNYVTHTRAAFAALAAEPEATPQHISLYVALFQQWNNLRFVPVITLWRDELMAAAHIGNGNTYLKCLRDLDKWGFLTYQPSRSSLRASCAIMHEKISANQEDDAPILPILKSESTTGASSVQAVSQVVVQAVRTTTKQSESKTNSPNLLNSAASSGKEKLRFNSVDELLSEAQAMHEPCNDSKEKVAPKRKVRARTPAQDRPLKRPEVPFAESELADLGSFIAAFTGTDFELANLRYYHEKVANWRRDGEPPRRRDWKATAKTFMLNDVERNALVLAPGTQHGPPGATPYSPHPSDHAAEYVSQRYS